MRSGSGVEWSGMGRWARSWLKRDENSEVVKVDSLAVRCSVGRDSETRMEHRNCRELLFWRWILIIRGQSLIASWAGCEKPRMIMVGKGGNQQQVTEGQELEDRKKTAYGLAPYVSHDDEQNLQWMVAWCLVISLPVALNHTFCLACCTSSCFDIWCIRMLVARLIRPWNWYLHIRPSTLLGRYPRATEKMGNLASS